MDKKKLIRKNNKKGIQNETHKNQLEIEPNEHVTLKITNQRSENIPDIAKEKNNECFHYLRYPVMKKGKINSIKSMKYEVFSVLDAIQTVSTQWNNFTTLRGN